MPMFVVIVCANCQGASQVDQVALGQVVQCPLCGKTTVARTREAVLPVAKPIEEQPLSLDDDDRLLTPSRANPEFPPEPRGEHAPAKPYAKRSPLATALYTTISLVFTLLVMGAIYGAFRYGNGDVSASDFQTFTPPGGNCTVQMPGEPVAEDVPVEGYAVLNSKRFMVNRWFERVRISFGWIDLEASKLEGATLDQIAVPFREREVKRLNAKIEGESLLEYVAGKHKLQAKRTKLDTPQGKAILQVYIEPDAGRLRRHAVEETERVNVFEREPAALMLTGVWLPLEIDVKVERKVLSPNQQIRLYFALIQGKKLDVDSGWVEKLLNSFVPE
jgi:hypothetical protein